MLLISRSFLNQSNIFKLQPLTSVVLRTKGTTNKFVAATAAEENFHNKAESTDYNKYVRVFQVVGVEKLYKKRKKLQFMSLKFWFLLRK